jgi:3-hydroxyisobutyrate dehydrogenase-like beta-hydroxyacid dehydrogenase
MTQVGLLGLGAMGSAIAGRLTDAGHELMTWNRTPRESVGTAVSAPAEALASPVSFSMLADDAAVAADLTEEALTGGPGRVHACLSSISPAASERLQSRCERSGVAYVAAPVLGRPEVAAAGQLNVLAGGPDDAVARIADLLAAIGKRTWRVSTEAQVANVIKVAVNYSMIHSLQALAESTALVEAYGVPAPEFAELLAETLFGGIVHRTYGDLIARRAYRPAGFTVPLGAKDLRLAGEVAAARDVWLPSAAVLDEIFTAALRRPGAEQDDWASIAEVTRSNPIAEEQPS